MMLECGFTPAQADRVAYLVGHHHTYTNIDGMDYQILVEADFLVNLYEDSVPKAAAQNALDKIFKRRQAKRSAKKCLRCKRYYDKFSARNRRLTYFNSQVLFATAPAGTIKPPKQNPTTQERTLTMIFADKLIALRKRQDIPRKNLPNS